MAGIGKRTLLREVNPHLICPLCRGYLIDATTVVECLHSFCRSCILKHLDKAAHCPSCKHALNKAKPNIKADKALQDIVYKLVPGLYHKEMRKRREFYKKHPEHAESATPEQRGDDVSGRLIFAPEDAVSLSLEYLPLGAEPSPMSNTTDLDTSHSNNNNANNSDNGTNNNNNNNNHNNRSNRRYLQCPALVTIAHLKKFVALKYSVDITRYTIEICHRRAPLPENWTLMDVAYIYAWKRIAPMRFFYRVAQEEQRLEAPLHQRPSTPGLGACLPPNDAVVVNAKDNSDAPVDRSVTPGSEARPACNDASTAKESSQVANDKANLPADNTQTTDSKLAIVKDGVNKTKTTTSTTTSMSPSTIAVKNEASKTTSSSRLTMTNATTILTTTASAVTNTTTTTTMATTMTTTTTCNDTNNKQMKSPIKIMKNPDGRYEVLRSPSSSWNGKEQANNTATTAAAAVTAALPDVKLTSPEFSVVSIGNGQNSNGVKITLKQCSPASGANTKKPKVTSNILLRCGQQIEKDASGALMIPHLPRDKELTLSPAGQDKQQEKQRRKVTFVDRPMSEKMSPSNSVAGVPKTALKRPAEQQDKRQFLQGFQLAAKDSLAEDGTLKSPVQDLGAIDENRSSQRRDNTTTKTEGPAKKDTTTYGAIEGVKEKRKFEIASSNANNSNVLASTMVNTIAKRINELPPGHCPHAHAAVHMDIYTFHSSDPPIVPAGAVKRKCPPGVPISDLKRRRQHIPTTNQGARKAADSPANTSPSQGVRKAADSPANTSLNQGVRKAVDSSANTSPNQGMRKAVDPPANTSSNQGVRKAADPSANTSSSNQGVRKAADPPANTSPNQGARKAVDPPANTSPTKLPRTSLSEHVIPASRTSNVIPDYHGSQSRPISNVNAKAPGGPVLSSDTRNLLDGCGLNIPSSLSITLTSPKSPGSSGQFDAGDGNDGRKVAALGKMNPTITLNDRSVDPRVLKALKTGQIKMPAPPRTKVPIAKQTDQMEMQQQQQQQPQRITPPAKRARRDQESILDLSGSGKKTDMHPLRIPQPVTKLKANNKTTNRDSLSDDQGQVVTLMGGHRYYRAPPGSLTPAAHRVNECPPLAPSRAPVYAPTLGDISRTGSNLSSVFPSLQSLYVLSQSQNLQQFQMDTRLRLPSAPRAAVESNIVSAVGGDGGVNSSGLSVPCKTHLAAQCAPVKPARSSIAPLAVPINKQQHQQQQQQQQQQQPVDKSASIGIRAVPNDNASKSVTFQRSNNTEAPADESSSAASRLQTRYSSSAENANRLPLRGIATDGAKSSDEQQTNVENSRDSSAEARSESTGNSKQHHDTASPRVSSTASPSPPPGGNGAGSRNEGAAASHGGHNGSNASDGGGAVSTAANTTSSGPPKSNADTTSCKSPASPDSSSVTVESPSGKGCATDRASPTDGRATTDTTTTTTTTTTKSSDSAANPDDSGIVVGGTAAPVVDDKDKLANQSTADTKQQQLTTEIVQKRLLAVFPSNEWANNPEAAEHLGNFLKSLNATIKSDSHASEESKTERKTTAATNDAAKMAGDLAVKPRKDVIERS